MPLSFRDSILLAETFFFEAMLKGYAANPKKGTIVELPWSKVITFEEDDFKLIDCWFVTPHSRKSWGFTQIFHQDLSIWFMTYWGEYDPEVIPFLKWALAAQYEIGPIGTNGFAGCRGPSVFSQEDGLLYVNCVEPKSTFANFSGREEVFSGANSTSRGWHRYHGWSLLPNGER